MQYLSELQKMRDPGLEVSPKQIKQPKIRIAIGIIHLTSINKICLIEAGKIHL